MNGKQLKNSILQWAIQGKLVPQDPNDEPASVLLEQIRAEKARLVKEKKIKKDKNESIIFRGDDNSHYEKFSDGTVKCIDDEIPFEIPESWEWERVGNIFQTTSGATPLSRNREYYENGDINWVRTTDLNNSTLSSCEIQITEKAAMDYNLTVLPRRSVCVAMYGGAGTIGKNCILDFDTTINQSVCAIMPNGFCNMTYLQIFVQYQRPYWMDFASGSRKDPNINQIIIKKCLVPIPPKSEQERITNTINLVLPLVEKYGKSQEKIDVLNRKLPDILKKSILQEAIQGKLVPQLAEEGDASELLKQIEQEKQKFVKEGKLKKKDLVSSTIFRGDDNRYYEKVGTQTIDITEEIPFEIPSSWVWSRIKNVFQINPKNECDDSCKAAFIPMENISAGYGSAFEYDSKEWGSIKKNFTHFADGDVAFAKITPCFQNRKSMILKDLPNGIGAGTTELKVLRPFGETINPWYTLYFLESSYFIDEAKFKGTANQQRIISGYLEHKLIPIPPLDEQERISNQIQTTLSKIGS